jgi:hypothetical protein
MCEFCQSNSKHKVQEVSVNAHLHTPYSFSAFDTLTDALNRAVAENVKVVGINDFYSMDGYKEWNDGCIQRKLFPLFNIEFISLQEEDQAAGIRVNDPNNPGRTYLSGKGLACPPVLPEPYASQLARVCAETHEQVKQMCAKLNELLAEQQTGIVLDFEWIEKNLTGGSIRERHLAKALRMKAYETFGEENQETLTAFFTKLFGGKPLKSKLSNVAGVENEIRGNLLKSGGAAFVAETPAAFLPMEDVRKIILAAGGIPTYPFLADDANGNFTQFEADVRATAAELKKRGIFSVEFITTQQHRGVGTLCRLPARQRLRRHVRQRTQHPGDGVDRALRTRRRTADPAPAADRLRRSLCRGRTPGYRPERHAGLCRQPRRGRHRQA